jgi:LysR family transcriptional regulator, carnitine catabolism transcriptional activator
MAIVPSLVIPACRNRQVAMSKVINPVVNLDFSRTSRRGRKLPSGSEEFASFLQGYIARWAGRAGIL